MNRASGRVVVVGSVNVDLVVASERLPAPGETVVGGTFHRFHGGKGGNAATAAARLGAPTLLVAALGDDDLGADARAALAGENVALDALATIEGVPTGVALILVDAHGENLISVASGANAELAPRHVEGAFSRLRPRPGDVVLVGNEIPTPTVRTALELGRAAGATTVFNPAPADGVDAAMLAATDILTPNLGELARLAGAGGSEVRAAAAAADVAAAARQLLSAAGGVSGGVRGAVLVSLGSRGALLVRASDVSEVPSPPVEAIDATGAGDTLNGALAAALVGGRSLEAAAHEAVVAASLSVTRAGAREGMPTREELDRALG